MMTLIHAIAGRPWAIRAELALHVRGLIAKEGIAGLRHLAALKDGIHAFDDDGRGARAAGRGVASGTVGAVAVIPVIGTLTQRVQVIGSAETRSVAQVAAEVRMAAVEPSVDGIVLEIDSPGGEVFGVPEAWASIRESGRMKPIVAHANSIAGSAALYLASAANEFWITPSGEAGSVGVYALHIDMSKALEEVGEAWDFIVASKSPYKIEGNPSGPLTDEARAHFQRDIDRYMDLFVRDLAKGRGVSEKRVETGFGGGRMLSPAAAVSAGMADGVGTFEQAIRRAADLSRHGREGARAELVRPAPAAESDHVESRARAVLAGVRLPAVE